MRTHWMRRRFVTLDVFTKDRFAGNPLAVVLESDGLDKAGMQAIAREFNLAETVFVMQPSNQRHRAMLRIFTPMAELPFAGHPTIGTAVLLGCTSGYNLGAHDMVLEESVGPVHCTVEAQGRTTQQLERAIEGKLRAGFLREPKVSVEVDTYRPFFVLGEVTNSGQFPYVHGMTVQTAVAIAGGFTPRGQRSSAEVTRQIDDRLVTASVPITYPVQPGDTIVIKERWF